jgi:hypothetical protein
MFEKFAKLHVLGPRHQAPQAPANDNNRDTRRAPSGSIRRAPPLLCRWSDEQGLTCRWEVDSAGRSNPLLDDEPRPDSWLGSRFNNAIHKSVFGPS